ncbi:MAG: hypothetical protein GX549_03765 [Clostridiales bacterium]|nr:hypothetical protein [Clostridiales bacterium]
MSGQYEANLEAFEEVVASTYYGGEAIPAMEVTLGPDQYAGFLGARILAHGDMSTTWAEAVVDDWSIFEAQIDREPGGYFDSIRRYMTAAAKYAKGKFLIHMLDFHSNMDALSALRGPQNFCLDLYDCPDEVHRALRDVRNTYAEIFDMAYDAGDMANRGSIGWSPTYCGEGRFAVIQCDFICMISPEKAREFVIPAIEEEAAFLDHSVFHLDGKGALAHLDDILAIDNIDVIQWVPGEGQPRTLFWMDLLKRIQKAGKSIWVPDWTADEIRALHKELEPDKVVYSLQAPSQAQAENLLLYLSRNT